MTTMTHLKMASDR